MKINDISVIVCTYNRAEMLHNSLNSLISLETDGTYSYEIVVVDDGSNDNTHDIVDDIRKYSDIDIKYVKGNGSGISSARNIGINASHSKWIAFFDDDQEADKNWLTHFYLSTNEYNPSYLGGRRLLKCIEIEKDLSPLSQICRAVLGEVDYGNNRMRCNRNMIPTAGNLMVKRDLLDKVGLFNESLIEGGEEVDLYRRILKSGHEAWYIPDALVYHLIPAYRRRKDYLIWTSLRNGDNFAYRDYKEWGKYKMIIKCVLRVGQALFINLPRILIAYIAGDISKTLGYKCLIYRAYGYLRRSVFTVFPSMFNESLFYDRLKFRSERILFVK